MANAGLRHGTLSMQKNEFVFSKSYGIDDISFLAIAPDVGRESQSCFCQLRDCSGLVIRCRHIASRYAYCRTTHDGPLLESDYFLTGASERSLGRFLSRAAAKTCLVPAPLAWKASAFRDLPLGSIVFVPLRKTKRSTGLAKTRWRKAQVQLTSTRERIKKVGGILNAEVSQDYETR
jgi:hypothetical protein